MGGPRRGPMRCPTALWLCALAVQVDGRREEPASPQRCLDGILHDGVVCCARECGTCAGAGCDARPGGASRCCGGSIQATCSTPSGPPPCIYREELPAAGEPWLMEDQPPPKHWLPPVDLDDENCWGQQFFPELCCVLPRGFDPCFGGDTSYDLCCTEFRGRRPQRVPSAPPLADPEDVIKVDLVVRTWHRDLAFLEVLLHSLALFWPFGRLRTLVTVVLREHIYII